MKVRTFRFPLATSAFVLAVIVLGAGLVWHIDLIDMPLEFLEKIEKSEVDEIITLLLLIGAGFLGDRAIEALRSLPVLDAAR